VNPLAQLLQHGPHRPTGYRLRRRGRQSHEALAYQRIDGGEFAVNMVTEALGEQMNRITYAVDAATIEFDHADLNLCPPEPLMRPWRFGCRQS
jgi:hypothetical protein